MADATVSPKAPLPWAEPSPRWHDRGVAFFRRHPALYLGLLAPMVEYLSGSTQSSWLVVNPVLFFAFLAQNLGSYGLAVILIREAMVRWNKGWGTVLLLGAAYGIINEGVGAATLFNPGDTAALGIVSTYGHALGVNWVWAVELVLIIHPMFSVTLPITLLDLSFPETRGRSLLRDGEIQWSLIGLTVDALGTLAFVGYVRQFYAGPTLWAGCAIAIAGCCGAAYVVRADILSATGERPTVRPLTMFVFVVGFFALMTFGSDALASMRVWPIVVAAFFVALGALGLIWVFRHVGRHDNERTLIALCAGLVAVLLPQGFFGQLYTGVGMISVVGYDLVVVALLVLLWRKHYLSTRSSITRGGVSGNPFPPHSAS